MSPTPPSGKAAQPMDNPLLFSEIIRDSDGDIWIRHESDERYQCLTSEDEARRTLEYIQQHFGPVQQPEWHDV